MQTQRETDHAAKPFRDVPFETERDAAERIAGIGRDRLMTWYRRAGRYTHPGSFGHSGVERTFGVAYALHHGTARDALTQRVVRKLDRGDDPMRYGFYWRGMLRAHPLVARHLPDVRRGRGRRCIRGASRTRDFRRFACAA